MESKSQMLDDMPEEIQMRILRTLLVSNSPIKLDPFNPVVPGTVPAGNMSIARVSKHFYHRALCVFYSENIFALPSTEKPTPPPVDIRWIKLHAHNPQSDDLPDTSLGCLNLIQQNPYGLHCISKLQLHLGQCGITCFYTPEYLSRLTLIPSLSALRFMLEPGWELVLEADFGAGFMDKHEKEILYPDFAGGFLGVVERGLGHVRRVVVQELEPGGGGVVVEVLRGKLRVRNLAWEKRERFRRQAMKNGCANGEKRSETGKRGSKPRSRGNESWFDIDVFASVTKSLSTDQCFPIPRQGV